MTVPAREPPPPDEGTHLREGDLDPVLNKTIEVLIEFGRGFIVYLDDKFFVQWRLTPQYNELPLKEFAEVKNRVSMLESIPTEHLSRHVRTTFHRLIGEGLARLLADRSLEAANQVFDTAQEWIQARNSEVARNWYLSASAVCAGIVLIAGLLVWASSKRIVPVIGTDPYNLLLASVAGSLGAFLSVSMRLKTVSVDPNAGRQVHYVDGALRIVVGFLGAAFVWLAMRAHIFLDFLASPPNAVLGPLVACMAAGLSERLVPDLVTKIELLSRGNDRQTDVEPKSAARN